MRTLDADRPRILSAVPVETRVLENRHPTVLLLFSSVESKIAVDRALQTPAYDSDETARTIRIGAIRIDRQEDVPIFGRHDDDRQTDVRSLCDVDEDVKLRLVFRLVRVVNRRIGAVVGRCNAEERIRRRSYGNGNGTFLRGLSLQDGIEFAQRPRLGFGDRQRLLADLPHHSGENRFSCRRAYRFFFGDREAPIRNIVAIVRMPTVQVHLLIPLDRDAMLVKRRVEVEPVVTKLKGPRSAPLVSSRFPAKFQIETTSDSVNVDRVRRNLCFVQLDAVAEEFSELRETHVARRAAFVDLREKTNLTTFLMHDDVIRSGREKSRRGKVGESGNCGLLL